MSKSLSGMFRTLLTMAAIGTSLAATQPLYAQDPSEIGRGRYLVNNVAMCGECHTPKIKNNQPDRDHWLKGALLHFHPGKPMPWFATYAPPIAGLPAGWSQAQVARFLQTGVTPGGIPPRAPMPPYRMDRSDAEAVAAYLHSLQ